MSADLLGYAAGTLTTVCFVPQAVKIVRDPDADGVSRTMYVLLAVGVAAWLAYGIAIRSAPVVIFNALTLALCLVILRQLFRRRSAPRA
ncbi:MAG: SemiSWEET family sugar transporter [Elusimicrobia bacterium]|nr:SemiSWEET family sugar transporter [Elusimicrobiota bacterium]